MQIDIHIYPEHFNSSYPLHSTLRLLNERILNHLHQAVLDAHAGALGSTSFLDYETNAVIATLDILGTR